MRITCPTCAAEYNVPGEIAAGRKVKCAKCGTKWAPVEDAPPEEPPPSEPEPEPQPEPMAAFVPMAPPPMETPKRQWALPAAWAGSFLVVAVALVGAVLLRGPIMQKWPPSERVYAALHLAPDSPASPPPSSPNIHGDVVK
ncbi:zinc-ribbon domain-containing protein [Acidisphaera sp. L21]|uniref:zinc-ribbon domain-containing protein n=1 Tax=Acidisphaera sp. L21 TaxID=1641851 RepID=UPI00131CD655|nr:zinc-ribbon domain-containing protein [Acidisphaera sp. L21]